MASAGYIVIAEDDQNLRTLYHDVLTTHGYDVGAAAGGAEALELMHHRKPKVVVLDIMMPGLDGIETCRMAREIIGDDVPVIFLTAQDKLQTVTECLEAGGDDYLIKSGSTLNLIDRVAHWATPRARANASDRRRRAAAELKSAV